MRVTIGIDSASADEARDFLVAFQATRGMPGEPVVLEERPTAQIMGACWTITTPAISPRRATAMAEVLWPSWVPGEVKS